jgi:hypothetical protein
MTTSFAVRSFNAASQENRMMSSVLARGRVRVLGALIALIGALAMSAGAGQAHAAGATIWPYAGASVPSGVTNGLGAVFAVNHESGNLLVLNSDGNDTAVLQMDETSTPVPFTYPALAGATALRTDNVPGGLADPLGVSGIGVDNTGTASQGNIYVVTANYSPTLFTWEYRLQGFKASGELLFDVTRPGMGSSVGVAPDGAVWVGTEGGMEELTPAGTPTGSAIEVPAAIAGSGRVVQSDFDAAGNMFMLIAGQVVRRSPSGVYRVLANDGQGLAVDPASGNALTSRYHDGTFEIDQFGPDGELEGATGVGDITYLGSLALGKDGRMLFMLWRDENTGQYSLSAFGPAVRRPEADAASDVRTTSAKLTGAVWPGGAATTYQFEYGLTKSLGSVAPSAPVDAGTGTGAVTATASLSGLKPQTFYYYRLKATVGGATVYGKVRSVRTGGPSAVLGGAGELEPSSATFSGTVDSYDLGAATYHVLVEGAGTPFSAVSAELPVPAGSGPQRVSASVAGLAPEQRFTARLVASAGGVTEASAPVSFTTPALGPVASVPEGRSSASPYGCGSPVIASLTARVRVGDVVTLAGSDLGVGGTVLVGGSRAHAERWSSTAVAFVVPDSVSGSVAVSVNCGHASNSVDLTVAAAAGNLFRLGASVVKGSSGAVSVALPGAGTVVSTGKYLAKSTKKVTKAGSVSVQLRLTAAGKRALAKSSSGALKVTAQVRYTPTGGSGRTLTKSITFKRGGSR